MKVRTVIFESLPVEQLFPVIVLKSSVMEVQNSMEEVILAI